MELRQLETFRVVMETLNMTAAAEEVGLSPPAVSLQVKRLSEELGAQLFIRMGPKVVPTLAAKRLQEHLDPLMNVLQAIREDFPPEIKNDDQPFILAAGMTTFVYHLRKPIRDLRKQFPENDIHVRVATTENIVKSLQSKHIDLGVVSLPLRAPNIRLTPLFEEEMLVLMSTRRSKGYRGHLSLRQLSSMPMILYPVGTNTREIIDRMLRRHDLTLQVIMELNNTEAIKRLVEVDFGASILPRYALRNSHSIRTFRIRGEHLCRQVAFATGRSSRSRKLTQAIMRYLAQQIARQNFQRV